MDKDFSVLYSFIDSAVRSRKYPESTANGLKVALKLFEAELNDDEKQSLQLFMDRLEQIYASVCAKNQVKFSISSLATYKSRVIKVVTDYQKYGVDPTKMANWAPKVITRAKRNGKQEAVEQPGSGQQPTLPVLSASNVASTTLVKDFGNGRVAQLTLPSDATDEERQKLSMLIQNM